MILKIQLFSIQIINSKYNAYYLVILRVLISIITVYLLNNEIIFCMNNNNEEINSYLAQTPSDRITTYIRFLETRSSFLEREMERTQAYAQEVRSLFEDLAHEYNDLSIIYQQKAKEVGIINQKYSKVMEENSILRARNNSLEIKIKMEQDDKETLKRSCRLLETQNEELKNQISQLQKKNTELERRLNSNFFLF